ncbi:lipopolysaccharide assembly protein LapA domain-containing protein [Endozoicomonas sp. 4G]|uniref:lipopolysaccharide assembly protein LapA domain-containing protein n=1 Tax=Endozoicomonas sp. 4G TaxID=2872754 RepID=UPI002078C287|nr:lipopolysaccharide assembly protein LapA domain-containing protein [Endozoicomonas sp. 4G]
MVSLLGIWLKRLVILLGSLLLLILLVNFIVANPQLIRFDLAGFLLPEVKVSSVVVISFILGGLFGLLVSLVATARLRLANASFKRKLGRRDAEIQKLRANALKGLT